FWFDVAQPIRVLKQAKGSDFVLSKYDQSAQRDAIPVEVTAAVSHPSGLAFATKFIRSNARFNLAVDPASFTIAGLGMSVGTPVNDIRIHRSIGYWTGAGLSENLPAAPKREAESQPPPNIAE